MHCWVRRLLSSQQPCIARDGTEQHEIQKHSQLSSAASVSVSVSLSVRAGPSAQRTPTRRTSFTSRTSPSETPGTSRSATPSGCGSWRTSARTIRSGTRTTGRTTSSGAKGAPPPLLQREPAPSLLCLPLAASSSSSPLRCVSACHRFISPSPHQHPQGARRRGQPDVPDAQGPRQRNLDHPLRIHAAGARSKGDTTAPCRRSRQSRRLALPHGPAPPRRLAHPAAAPLPPAHRRRRGIRRRTRSTSLTATRGSAAWWRPRFLCGTPSWCADHRKARAFLLGPSQHIHFAVGLPVPPTRSARIADTPAPAAGRRFMAPFYARVPSPEIIHQLMSESVRFSRMTVLSLTRSTTTRTSRSRTP